MDGYIRVSSVGQRDVESESYQTERDQQERIEAWAKQRGVEIAAWHADRDQTGSKLERPGFDACMARMAAGATGGIVVAQIDRLSRADVADALMTVRTIHDEYRGTLVALDLGIDPTTEVGEMLLTVLLALARMQWRRYAAAWERHKSTAAARGAHIGPAPLGYRHGEAGRLEPDPETAPHVTKAFELAASDSLNAAMTYLLETGALSANSRVFHVRRLLERRTYLGESSWNGTVVPDAHQSLTDLATWTRAQRPKVGPARAPKGNYPLTNGPCRCGTCGSAMVGTKQGRRKYRCGTGGGRKTDVVCDRKAWADADQLETWVRELLVLEAEVRMGDEAHAEAWKVTGGDSDLGELEAALRTAELRRDEDVANIDLRADLLAKRLAAHDAAIAAAREAYEIALAESEQRIVFTADEIREAEIAELPGFMDKLGVRAVVRPGSEHAALPITLEPV
jgi:DNA invertase Pin-like site-specific DNA recombinase